METGSATQGFMPSRLTRMSEGAYIPIPSVISAPSTKFTATANTDQTVNVRVNYIAPPASGIPPGGR